MKYALLAILVFFCFSCQKDKKTEPAKIFYGEDICENCKMIISESEFAAQYILHNHQIKKFDDIGCMSQFISKNENSEKVDEIFVKDFHSNKWINGKNAYYVKNKKIRTPMGHNVLAFENFEDAKQLQNEYLGGFTELQKLLSEE